MEKLISINSHWETEVKNIVNNINKAISTKNKNLLVGMILELMKYTNTGDDKLKSSAAWAFSEISESHGKFLKNAIPSLISLLDEIDTFIITYAINALDNLIQHYPDQVFKAIPLIAKALDNFDPGLRRTALRFFLGMAEKNPDVLKSNPDAIRELKLTAKDLDRSISSIAKEVLAKINE